MNGSFWANVLEFRKRTATWVLLAVWLILTELFAYVIPYTGYRTGGGDATARSDPRGVLDKVLPAHLLPSVFGGFPVFVGALVLIFGVLSTGSDYGWGTLKTSLTQRCTRTAMATGKMLALVVMVLAGMLAVLLVAAATSVAIALTESRSLHLAGAADLAEGLAAGALILVMWAVFGAALGTLFRGVALPIGLGVVWILGVENLVSSVADSLLPSLRGLRDVLPGVDSGAIVYSLDPIAARGGGPAPGVDNAVSSGRGVVTLLCYVAVFAAALVVAVRERDVT